MSSKRPRFRQAARAANDTVQRSPSSAPDTIASAAAKGATTTTSDAARQFEGDDDDPLEALPYRELQNLAKREGLPRNKSAAELRKRLRAARSQAQKGGADGAKGGQDKKRLKTGDESKEVVKKPLECKICREDMEDPDEGIKLNRCGKTVHKTCLLRAITNPIGIYHMSDIDCPVCAEHTLARTTVELILADNPGLMKAWKHAVLDSQYGERLLPCPEPDCDHYHILTDKDAGAHPTTLRLDCGHVVKLTDTKGKDKATSIDTVSGANFRACPWCGVLVERTDGCPSMRCMCRKVWCYDCGAKEAICECTFFAPVPPQDPQYTPAPALQLPLLQDDSDEDDDPLNLSTPPPRLHVPLPVRRAVPPPPHTPSFEESDED